MESLITYVGTVLSLMVVILCMCFVAGYITHWILR